MAVAALLALVAGCATLGGLSRRDAVASAVSSVCGPRVADSTCVVRGVSRVEGGYQVVVDRRPPALRQRRPAADDRHRERREASRQEPEVLGGLGQLRGRGRGPW